MHYQTLKRVLMGIAMLMPLSMTARDFNSELLLSDEETTYWYRISCAASGMDGLAMTDLSGSTGTGEASRMIYMMPTETEDQRSQWKLTAGEDGRFIITNRATGQQISNASSSEADHNITMLTASDAPGLTVTALGDYAFRLESVEDDGVNRCLALADKDAGAIFYPESDESSSAIGWKFLTVEIVTGMNASKGTFPTLRVKNRHVIVSGCSEWKLYNAGGEELPRTVSLPTGIYLVKMPHKSVKVLIP